MSKAMVRHGTFFMLMSQPERSVLSDGRDLSRRTRDPTRRGRRATRAERRESRRVARAGARRRLHSSAARRAPSRSAQRGAQRGGGRCRSLRPAWRGPRIHSSYRTTSRAEASRLVRLGLILVSSLVRGLSSDLTLRATGSDLATTSPATQVPPTAAPRPFPC